jgi:ParB family chromosome partitioning protein
MTLDLSGLDEPDEPGAAASGRPLLLKVADIDEDPDQPRTEFDLTEMRSSIRAKLSAGKAPIKQPISVKPNAARLGRWLLNDGARRYRSCKAEGVEEIPAWVDEEHDDYDQVIVNNQHDKLKPMELALFIKKKLGDGDTKTTIADRLGYDNAVITHHLALIDAPDCVVNAYRSGKTRSARTLYELRHAYERWPEQFDAWVDSVDEITRPQIGKLLKCLEAPECAANGGSVVGTTEASGGVDDRDSVQQPEFGHDQTLKSTNPTAARTEASGSGPMESDNASGEQHNHGGDQLVVFTFDQHDGKPEVKQTSAKHATVLAEVKPSHKRSDTGDDPPRARPGAPAVNEANALGHTTGKEGAALRDGGNLTSWPEEHAVPGPERMTKPLLLVEYEGRVGVVLLNRRPSTPGCIRVRFDDGNGDQEINAGLCKINLLTEADVKVK